MTAVPPEPEVPVLLDEEQENVLGAVIARASLTLVGPERNGPVKRPSPEDRLWCAFLGSMDFLSSPALFSPI